MTNRLSEIRAAAIRVRNAMETADFADCADNLGRFPKECCSHASSLLLVHFHDVGIEGFRLMRGKRPVAVVDTEPPEDSGHEWIQKANIVVDITADQFDGQRMPVVFVGQSSWHNNLQGFLSRDALDWDIRFYKEETRIFAQLLATGCLSARPD